MINGSEELNKHVQRIIERAKTDWLKYTRRFVCLRGGSLPKYRIFEKEKVKESTSGKIKLR